MCPCPSAWIADPLANNTDDAEIYTDRPANPQKQHHMSGEGTDEEKREIGNRPA